MSDVISDQEQALIAASNAARSPMDKARALVALSELRVSYGDLLMGERALSQAQESLPHNRDIILRRARSLNQLGEWRTSLAVLEGVVVADRASAAYWLCLADTYRYAKLWAEALEATQSGLRYNPHSEALLLLSACAKVHVSEFEAAQATFKALQPKAEAFELYGAALAHNDKIEHAIACLEAGLVLFPDSARLISALCMIRWMQGHTDSFADVALAAMRKFQTNLNLTMTASDLLRRGGQLAQARDILVEANARSQVPELQSALALLTSIGGDNEEALELARKSLVGGHRLEWIRRNCATIHLSAADPVGALEQCAWGLARNSIDQEWIAIDATARRMLGDLSYTGIMDYQNFVKSLKVDLTTPDASHEANLHVLANHVRSLHSYSSHPLDQSLRSGTQLPLDPKDRSSPLFAAFFKAIEAPIRSYIAGIVGQPGHPFTSRVLSDYDISGAWSVRLHRYGEHVNHIHPEGWISAVFYLKLPGDSDNATKGEGNLCFGQPNFKAPNLGPDYHIVPVEGELVLFPSYFWHGTVPLTKDVERLTIAFDLIPKADQRSDTKV